MKYLSFTLFFFIVAGNFFAQNWKPIGPFNGKDEKGKPMHTMGYVSAVYMNPKNQNEIFMGTNSSGIFKTTNRGISWECVTNKSDLIPGMGIQSITVNLLDENVMLAAATNFTYGKDTYYGRILVSKDKGENWNILESFSTGWKDEIVKIIYKNAHEVYVASSSAIFYSNDDLKTWELIYKIDDKNSYIDHNYQIIVDFEIFENGNIILATGHKWGGAASLWLSKNNGEYWEDIIKSNKIKGFTDRKIVCSKISAPVKNKLVVAISIGTHIYLYQSNDFANTFSKIGEFKTDYETGDAKASKFEIEISKQDTSKLYFGFIEFFDWTKKQGLKRLSPTQNISAEEHDDVRSMEVYINPYTNKEYLLMGNDGGVSMYYPDENRFESINGDSLNTVQVYNMGMSQYGDDFKILIGTQDNGTFQYQNNDWKWVAGGDGGASWLSKEGDKQFYCMNATLMFQQGRIRRYFTPNKKNSSWFINYPATMKPNEKTIVFGSNNNGGKGATLFVQDGMSTPKNGVEIEKINGIQAIEISDNNGELIYISSSDFNDKNENTPRLFKTIDGGNTFIDLTKTTVYSSNYNDTLTLFDLLSYRVVMDIEIDPLDDEIVYISLSGVDESDANKLRSHMRVLKSDDGGNSWVDFSAGLPIFPVNVLVRHAGAKELIFCGTDKGMYYRKKGDNFWRDFNGGFPKNLAVTDLKINYCKDKLFASTYGRGIWEVVIPNTYKEAEQRITTDEEWNFEEKLQLNDLVIKKKKTLQINGDLVLAKNRKVILEPKSKLIINGGEIKTKCEGDWEKIIIEEKKFLFFFKGKKGKIINKQIE